MKKAISVIIICCILIPTIFQLKVLAYTDIKITYNGQVVDSFAGVDAIYATLSSYSNVDTNTTYSCAAFLKKFCSKLWGVTIYNINTVNAAPTVTKSGHSVYLKTVSSPRPGDIMQTKNYGHVAVVKSVSGSNAILIEQNWSYNSGGYRYARKERSVPISSVYFYRMVIDGVEAEVPGVTTSSYADIGDDFFAKIINTSSGKCLTNDLDNVSIRTDGNSTNQWWHFTKNEDNTYKIASMHDQTKCLDVHLSGTALKTNIKVATDNGGNAQKWKITGSQGSYVLQALCTSNVLDIADGSTKDGSNVQTYTSNGTAAQLFTIEVHTLGMPINIGSNFYAYIYNYGLDTYVTNQASNVVSCSKTDSTNQKWIFIRNADYSYKIQSVYDGKCIDVDNYGNGNGVNIKVEKDNGDTAQRWYLYKSGEGYYLRAKCTHKVMDVAGGVSNESTNIQTYTSNNSVAQLFNVNKISLLDITFDATGGSLDKDAKAETYADSINADRGSNQIALFNKGDTTGTNAYGYEVVVNYNNKVTETIYAVGNATIPAGGFVLSGHGTKSTWLDENIEVGDYVSINEENGKITVYSADAWIVINKHVFTGDKYDDLPTPHKNGYEFKGWFADKNGKQKITRDTIVTATENIILYAMWEVAIPHTSSVVTRSGAVYTIETQLHNFVEPCNILVIGYKDNIFVSMQFTPYSQAVSSCTISGDIDEIKVMVWDGLSTLKPLCSAEVIPSSEWITE